MVSRTSCCGALLLIASCAAVTPIPPSASEVTVPLTTASLAVAGNIGGRAAVIRLDPGRPLSFAKGACPVQRSGATVRVEDPTNGRAQEFSLGILPSLALGDFRFSKLEVATSLSNDACEVVLGDDALQGLTLEIDFPAARATLRRSTGEPLPGNFEPIPLTRNPNFDWPLLAVRIVQGGTTFVTPALFSLQVPASTLIGNVTELRTAQEIATQLDAWGIQALKPSRPDAYPIDTLALLPSVRVGPTFLDVRRGQGAQVGRGFEAILGADFWRGRVLRYQAGSGVLLVRTAVDLPSDSAAEARALLERVPAREEFGESVPDDEPPL